MLYKKMNLSLQPVRLGRRCLSSRRYFAGMTEFLRPSPRFRLPLNPNPAISSGRYTGIGNGIVHSNGHRFPPAATATAAAGRSRGEGQCRGMILPIFGLILVRMRSAVCRGVRPFSLSLPFFLSLSLSLASPLERGRGRARRCTLDARADYHLNVPTGGQPFVSSVTLTAPTYLSVRGRDGSTHPPDHPRVLSVRPSVPR